MYKTSQMQKAIISIVYHSANGHTGQVARLMENHMRSNLSQVCLVKVEDAKEKMETLHSSDTIVFGSPTIFGNVSARFKQFMELTDGFWYKQCWKDKLAAGFTVSSTCHGDKLNVLNSLMLFAAQHSMLWISQGILPRFINDEQTEGQNRLASYIGLMTQCNNGKTVGALHPGDVLTVELFAKRILDITLKHKNLKIYNYDTSRN